jgi:hypothetical protein
MREGHGLGGPRFCGAADRPLATEITEDTEVEQKNHCEHLKRCVLHKSRRAFSRFSVSSVA